MQTNTYISGSEMLSDITPRVQDSAMRWRAPGYYMRRMKMALEELAFDTLYDEQYIDTAIPDSLQLEMPSGVFNVKRVYLYSGNECEISKSVKVHFKRNFDTRGGGYTADEKDHVTGQAFNISKSGRESYFFYGLRNGTVLFSGSCRSSYPKARVYFNGVFGPMEDLPIVPILARQAVIEWVVESALKDRMSEDPSGPWSLLWRVANQSLSKGDPLGLWENTKYRLSMMDAGAREDFNQYMSDITNK